MKVLGNQDFLLLKQSVSRKVIQHLSSIERALHAKLEELSFNFPKDTFLQSGKISKGENYSGLPYFMLDYRRKFSKTDVFAFRTMLWWGNYYSCTLQISGESLKNYEEKILKNILDEQELYFCINSNPWEYHYNESNFLTLKDLDINTIKKHIDEHGFVKISDKIALNRWKDYKAFSEHSLARFLMLLS